MLDENRKKLSDYVCRLVGLLDESALKTIIASMEYNLREGMLLIALEQHGIERPKELL